MPTPYRLIIAGGRDFNDRALFDEGLQWFAQDAAPVRFVDPNVMGNAYVNGYDDTKGHVLEVISGMAKGADSLGAAYAQEAGIPLHKYPANWKDLEAPGAVVRQGQYGPYNANAGFDRNRRMAEAANGVLLFPGGRGTAHMAQIAQEMGLDVFDYRNPSNPVVLRGSEAPARTQFLIDSKAPLPLGRALSPLNARLSDGRTIEEAYQQAKGYSTWREGKGKPAITPDFDYEGVYQSLYQRFADENPQVMDELALIARDSDLIHPRARTTQNPAIALTRILEQRGADAIKQLELLEGITPPTADGPAPQAESVMAGKRWPLVLAAAGGIAALGGGAYLLNREDEQPQVMAAPVAMRA